MKRLMMVENDHEKQSTSGLLNLLRRQLGIQTNLPEGYAELDPQKRTWILIDDAQLIFGEACRGFWQATIKHLENSSLKNIGIIVAATYELNSQGSTPIVFRDYHHAEDVLFTREESV